MRGFRKAVVPLVLLFTFVLAVPAEAQYFGRNKVQWENFKFKTLRTEHFDIYYYDREDDVVQDIGRMAERWYTRLSRVFNHSFGRKPIVLYANSADFHQTTTTGGFIGVFNLSVDAVPESTSVALLAVGGLTLRRRRA